MASRRDRHPRAKTGRRSGAGAASLVAAIAGFVCGCGSERRLRDEQRRLVPASFELVDCEFASGLYGLVSPPASYCVYLVAGTRDEAANELQESLAGHGYAVDRAPYFEAIELTGRGSDLVVQARVGRRDVGPHLVPHPLPVGHVAVSLTVGEPES